MEDLSVNGGRGLVVDEGRKGDWAQTWTGRRFYPGDPRPEDLDILDVAYHLSNGTRYAGACRRYSQAEHSVLVSKIVKPGFELCGLMHDGPEFMIADVIRPVKRNIGRDNEYFVLDDNIWRKAFAPRWGLPLNMPKEVLIADTQIVVLEKAQLHPRSQAWDLPFDMPKGVWIECYDPNDATVQFLKRYCELTGEAFAPLVDRFWSLIEQDQYQFEQVKLAQVREARELGLA